MKNLKRLIIANFFILLFVPLICRIFIKNQSEEPSLPKKSMEVTVYNVKKDKCVTMDCFDYLCATVAAEMSPSSPTEALKAQTVAAFTYMLNKSEYVKNNPDANIGHNGAYVCDDSAHCMAFIDKETAKNKWGDAYFDKYYPNIENAVSAVMGEYLTYEGKPINAVFHSMSSGKTYSAKEVWGSQVPYLVSVDSSFDTQSKDFVSTKTVSNDDFKKIFYDEFGVTLPEDRNKWLGEIVNTDEGMVKQMVIADTVYAGTHLRSVLGLKSASFVCKLTGDGVEFTVYGYGHGVGMSQNGAKALAQKGYGYRKILAHYYTATEISELKF